MRADPSRAILFCGALAACGEAAPAKAPPAGYDFPALTGRGGGRVVDAADLLPAEEEQKLNARLAEVERGTKHQFVVVTVKSLGGHPINEYGLALGNFWGVGRAGVNDGVMLLVAPSERKARIEVGYGLETSLTNNEAAEILRTAILPRFSEGDMPAGILAGSEAIIKEITP